MGEIESSSSSVVLEKSMERGNPEDDPDPEDLYRNSHYNEEDLTVKTFYCDERSFHLRKDCGTVCYVSRK